MKLKSLILGAAGIFAVTGAQAADLPPAPEPVDYVRVCDAFGSGFFYIPGTDSCLRLRGRLRVETRYRHSDFSDPVPLQARGGLRAASPFFTRARGYWGWDHRTNTDIGLVRAFFRGNLTVSTGGGTRVGMDYAFIQIGGLTVGYTDLIIEPIWSGYTLEHSFSVPGFENEEVLAQYVYSFGNGFSLGGVVFDQTTSDFRSFGGIVGLYGGNRMPSAGAGLTYEGSFGSFRLSGVVRDIRPGAAISADHTVGWGGSFSGEIGVPLGTNTSIGFNVQYADGIMEWLHEDISGMINRFSGVGGPDFTTLAIGGIAGAPAVALKSKTAKGWSIGGGITTQVFDRTTFNISGGYTNAHFNYIPDMSFYDIQANLAYRLTGNLVITAEAQYRNLNQDHGVRTSDGFSTILRAQLDY